MASLISPTASFVQVWQQLLHTGFLPSQKVVILKLSTETSLQASSGLYGMMMIKQEVTTGEFPVTVEYLKLLIDVLLALPTDDCSVDQKR